MFCDISTTLLVYLSEQETKQAKLNDNVYNYKEMFPLRSLRSISMRCFTLSVHITVLAFESILNIDFERFGFVFNFQIKQLKLIRILIDSISKVMGRPRKRMHNGKIREIKLIAINQMSSFLNHNFIHIFKTIAFNWFNGTIPIEIEFYFP